VGPALRGGRDAYGLRADRLEYGLPYVPYVLFVEVERYGLPYAPNSFNTDCESNVFVNRPRYSLSSP
jgi:hypothetical protein